MRIYPEILQKLIEAFKKMPGIGPKSAQRLAFYIIDLGKDEAGKLAYLIKEANEKVRSCSICGNLATADLCPLCSSGQRDQAVVCVVSDPRALAAIERMGEYHGVYHVLSGLISPIDGITPDNLNIKSLLKRLENGEIKEIILALSPTTEGEATTLYLTKLLKPVGLKITRIAYGLPMGADMDYTDEVTIFKALEGRREL